MELSVFVLIFFKVHSFLKLLNGVDKTKRHTDIAFKKSLDLSTNTVSIATALPPSTASG